MPHDDLAALARTLNEQEQALSELRERASAHGDVVLHLAPDVDESFGDIVAKLSRPALPMPRIGVRV